MNASSDQYGYIHLRNISSDRELFDAAINDLFNASQNTSPIGKDITMLEALTLVLVSGLVYSSHLGNYHNPEMKIELRLRYGI